MTSYRRIIRANFFARNDLRDLLPLSIHDQNLVGDTRTTVRLNYEWRVFVVRILEGLMEYNSGVVDDADLDAFNEVYHNLLVDLYT